MSDDNFDDGSERDARRIDDLAQRAVDSFMTLVRRGTALAGGTLAIVSVICIGSFALGVAALSDGMETVWIVLGGLAAVAAIGSVVVAIWRLLVIRTMSVTLSSWNSTPTSRATRSTRSASLLQFGQPGPRTWIFFIASSS